MYNDFKAHLSTELTQIENAGLFKKERIITTAQGASIRVAGGQEVLNFCANNYLGLSNNPQLIQAAKNALWFIVLNSTLPIPYKQSRLNQ